VQNLKEEVAIALNDTSDPPRKVQPDDITIYKQFDGRWRRLDEDDKSEKRVREATLEDLDIRGVMSGSTIEGDGETLAYTVKNGLEGEESIDIEAFPQDD
jgi:hypothetical protein